MRVILGTIVTSSTLALFGLVFSCGGSRQVGDNSTDRPQESEVEVGAAKQVDEETSDTTSRPISDRKKRYRSAGSKVRVGERALDLSGAVDSSGNPASLESHTAPLLVLTFGASWCAPCKKELPALDRIASGFDAADVDFVAVNIDSSRAAGQKFMKGLNLRRVQVIFDPKNSSVRRYDPPTMPSVFIVKEGIVTHLHPGFRSGDESKLKAEIARNLR